MLEFTKKYDGDNGLTNGVRTHWTTMYFIDDNILTGFRRIHNIPRKLMVDLEAGESFSSVLTKIDRLTMIDDDMFILMAETMKRAKEDLEELV